MHKDQKRDQVKISPDTKDTFWNDADILEIIEHILLPQKGPPSVIEDSDAVSNKNITQLPFYLLNLQCYRFVSHFNIFCRFYPLLTCTDTYF